MILLVRHPPVEAGGRCYGRLDLAADPGAVTRLAAEVLASMQPPLSAQPPSEGWGGAEGCNAHPVTACPIWTSPALRCRAVAQALGPYTVDDRLQELDFGAWEGISWDDVPRASLDAWAADPWGFAPPGGENGHALVARVRAFAADCMTDPCVVITHGGPLKVLTALLRKESVGLLVPALPASAIVAFSPEASPTSPPCRG